MDALAIWLRKLGLEQYHGLFAENGVDLNSVRLLTDSDLEKLGLLLGHRRMLLKAVAELKDSESRTSAVQPIQETLTRGTAGPEAERRQLTVLFCDLVGSTALAEHLDPEELRDLMQAYQRACGEVIARYEGHVAQYLGDGLMVYFGWPRAHEDDPVRAVLAGLEVTETISRLNASTPICARVGIHTGLVVVGETGQGDASVPKAAVGETPNIAARLQALAEPGSVVVSKRTRALTEGLFEYADLGVQPLKGLSEPVQLYRVMSARSIDSRFDASHGEVELTPMVGREEEIALLLRRWAQAKGKEGQVVLLGGEPGIGKSRLTRALREHIAGESYTFLRYQCSPYHLNSAFYPIIEQVKQAANFAREDTPDQKLDKMEALLAGSEAQRAEAAPLFAAMLSLPVDRYPLLNLTPQKQKDKILEALAGQAEAFAQRQPLLIIQEDAQWIDPTSQAAFDLLVPRLHDLPVLLIVTHRPEYRPKWSEHAHVTVLGLNRLDRGQGTDLVGNLTRGKMLPRDLLEQIVAQTDGVPLFVEELTKSVLESTLLADAGDHYTLQGPLRALAIPTTLRDSLIARLDRLAPIREIAQIGACIGREFSYELLASLSPLQDERLEYALEQLTSSGLVFRRGMPPHAVYSFKHALVQEAAYDSLLKSTRHKLHGRIARVLEERFPEICDTQPEILAHHYTVAGLVEQAIDYWQRAGQLALGRVALSEAVSNLNKGLELVATLPQSAARDIKELHLRTPLGTAWAALRGWPAPEVEASFNTVLRLANALDHSPSYLPALYGLWRNHFMRGTVAESLKWVSAMQDMPQARGDAELKICAHVSGSATRHFLGHFKQSNRDCERIAALYDVIRSRDTERITTVDALTARGIWGSPDLWMLGYPDQALRLHEATETHTRAPGHPLSLCWFLTVGTWLFLWRGEPDRLLARTEEGEQLARAQGLPIFFTVLAPMFRGAAWLQMGRNDEGMAELQNTLDKWTAVNGHVVVPYFKGLLAEGVALTGDIEKALELINECVAQIGRPGWEERGHLAEVLRLRGWMLQLQGRHTEAEHDLRAAMSVAREQDAKSLELRCATTLARLVIARGAKSQARDLLEPIYGWFTEGFDTKDLKEAKLVLQQSTE